MTKLQELNIQLTEQALQMEQTVLQMTEEAMKEGSSSDTKHFILTQLYSKHFGKQGLLELCEKIKSSISK